MNPETDLFAVYVNFNLEKNGEIELVLRRKVPIKNLDVFKAILLCTLKNQPITILPSFSKELNSISRLIGLGVLGVNEEETKTGFSQKEYFLKI